MNRELIKNYVNYLNKAIKIEEDPNEAYILEGQRDDLLDILEENNVYRAIEDLGSFCPDEKIVGTYECVGLNDGFSCFCCEQCWKNILGYSPCDFKLGGGNMLVDELRELTSNSKQYQEEYEEIVRKLREVAASGLNEMKVMGGISNAVKDKLRKEGLTITYKCNLDYDLTSYDLIQW